MSNLDRAYQIIKKPVITEKASDDTGKRNAYHFRVPVDANKVEIRKAVEELFDVTVVDVNTLRLVDGDNVLVDAAVVGYERPDDVDGEPRDTAADVGADERVVE
mgnify:CR=1 FL=1